MGRILIMHGTYCNNKISENLIINVQNYPLVSNQYDTVLNIKINKNT